MIKKNSWKTKSVKRISAFMLAAAVGMLSPLAAGLGNAGTAYAYTEKKGSINATTLNVRSAADPSSQKLASLRGGTAVVVIDETTGSDGKQWYKIRFGTSSNTGYVQGSYVKFNAVYTRDENFEKMLTDQGFPESYKERLRLLHAEYPKWVFKAQHTGLEWETVIENESIVGRNLVHTNSKSSWKSVAKGAYDWNTSTWPGFDTSAWVAANETVIRHYMDPRNFLDSIYVFQFLNQRYDPAQHNVAGIETLVRGTFMESRANNADVINAAKTAGENSSSSQPQSASQNVSVSQTPPGADSGAAAGALSAPAESTAAETGAAAQETSAAAQETTEAVRSGLTPLSSGGGSVSLEAPGAAQTQTEAQNEGPAASISIISKDSSDSSTGPGIAGSSSGGAGTGNDKAATDYQPIAGDKTYVDILLEAAVASGVSPYVLASMIIQEQGLQGSSGLISGNTEPYQGIYNFYNIEAYQSGSMSPTQRGLWWASQNGSYNRPWNSKEKAIIGGAIFYGNNYVKSGQDTFYLKKFNVQGDNLYKHQYMTYVEGAALEGARLSKAYSAELKDSGLVFTIPVFKNMPEETVALPEGDGSPNNKLKSLGVEGYALTPTFNMDTESYDLIVPSGISSVRINAAAADANASVSGTGDVSLEGGGAAVSVEVKAQNASIKKYTIQIKREGGSQGGNASGSQTHPSEGDTDIRLSPPSGEGGIPASSESAVQDAAVGLTPGDRGTAGVKKAELRAPGGN